MHTEGQLIMITYYPVFHKLSIQQTINKQPDFGLKKSKYLQAFFNQCLF